MYWMKSVTRSSFKLFHECVTTNEGTVGDESTLVRVHWMISDSGTLRVDLTRSTLEVRTVVTRGWGSGGWSTDVYVFVRDGLCHFEPV